MRLRSSRTVWLTIIFVASATSLTLAVVVIGLHFGVNELGKSHNVPPLQKVDSTDGIPRLEQDGPADELSKASSSSVPLVREIVARIQALLATEAENEAEDQAKNAELSELVGQLIRLGRKGLDAALESLIGSESTGLRMRLLSAIVDALLGDDEDMAFFVESILSRGDFELKMILLNSLSAHNHLSLGVVLKHVLDQHKVDLLHDPLVLEWLLTVVEVSKTTEIAFPAISDIYWQVADAASRGKIIEVLGKLGTPEAARFLGEAARRVAEGDSCLGEFFEIIGSITKCQSEAALKELEQLLTLPDRGRAAAAVCGIGRICGEGVEQLLLRIAHSCEDMPGLQAQAMRALVTRCSEAGIQMVLDLCSSDLATLPDGHRIGVQVSFPLIPADRLSPEVLLHLLESQTSQVLRKAAVKKLMEHGDFLAGNPSACALVEEHIGSLMASDKAWEREDAGKLLGTYYATTGRLSDTQCLQYLSARTQDVPFTASFIEAIGKGTPGSSVLETVRGLVLATPHTDILLSGAETLARHAAMDEGCRTRVLDVVVNVSSRPMEIARSLQLLRKDLTAAEVQRLEPLAQSHPDMATRIGIGSVLLQWKQEQGAGPEEIEKELDSLMKGEQD